ncbi:5'-methylthioadenosine/S-adenosylhomocysteine nucleosidase [Planctomycetes bacterium Pla163]|uniref:5'-methylthioadenosine/S-adenosylhomocysteine nucleosidase n=1 Tax=Rohdeia mirabilis TaxID=2528008 RepID=A0A518D063_9BACT|nr:5'-methylthioadenosine/S-adenosylhomocysteine nucleosidase [Planctomycetes bacterium Pla163]
MTSVDLTVLAALGQELAPLSAQLRSAGRVRGMETFEGEISGCLVRAAVGGVGKVAAARAAALLIDPAPRFGLVVIGVCGGLSLRQKVGTLVHCAEARQIDLHLPWPTDVQPDPELLAAWRRAVPGPSARFLTADRAAITPWRRLARQVRFGPGACVVDMETAAAGWVAQSSGVPWGALRSLSDTQGLGAMGGFRRHFHAQAPRAAATIPTLLAELLGTTSMESSP